MGFKRDWTGQKKDSPAKAAFGMQVLVGRHEED
jgi:hypothetical protein